MSAHSHQTHAGHATIELSYKQELEKSDVQRKSAIPVPSHRHAAPSAPWPWIDISDEIDEAQLNVETPPIPPLCDHKDCGGCWTGYPQSRFPNWTDSQQERAKIRLLREEYDKNIPCVIYQADVNSQGFFTDAGKVTITEADKNESWQEMIDAEKPENNRVRALFIQDLSGPVMQMLGAKYNIEPFFYSASLNWIPSRYQEDPHAGHGDHITICVTFLKSVKRKKHSDDGRITPPGWNLEDDLLEEDVGSTITEQMIDTQAPLKLRSRNRQLVLDLLSVHLIRNQDGSTIISYHPRIDDHPTTEASYLHERIRYAGQSVYWQKMFQTCPDPTFVLLTFIWHSVYAWDQALQDLYSHICHLETKVISSYNITVTQELHVIRAHLLYYSSLLEDLRKTIEFVRDTRNPAMDAEKPDTQKHNSAMMKRECANLINEVDRLEHGRLMQDRRLKNVMNLVFSSVNIDDSHRMQKMTEAAVKDSAAMKQIAYLTMIFLPASFIAAVFGMNVKEFASGTKGTLGHYLGVALSLTAATVWVIIAFQSKWMYNRNTSVFVRLGWPVKLLKDVIMGEVKKQKVKDEEVDPAFPRRLQRASTFKSLLPGRSRRRNTGTASLYA